MSERLTTRERREARVERRRDWAEGRKAKGEAAHQGARVASDLMPLGEPIHPGAKGRRQRNAIRATQRTEQRGVEHLAMARHHTQRADNLEAQLDRSIFSDDVDAVERLEQRIAVNEARRDEMKARNAKFRKHNRVRLNELSAFQREQAMPHPAFELSNLGARIRTDKKRLEDLRSSREVA
jgi:Domain of unknown function (DUF3560)